MAQIDVSELFTDPDFVDEMTLITRVSLVNSQGENIIQESAKVSVGSVQPADYRTLKRLPDGLQNENVMSFWFKGEIITTAAGRYPSILLFKGKRFQVQQVQDWTNWGQGWCEGICVAEKPA